MNTKKYLAACALAVFAGGLAAQTVPPPQNVLQLQATGRVEVPQDLLVMTLTATREGQDPAVVQSQLKTALDAALNEAKRNAQPGQLDVRTGNFALYPRHGKDGKIAAWNGTVELVLEGRDFARITQTAGRINTMTLGGMGFALSREARQRVEGEAQTRAIESFKARANELAKGFGFTGYTLREVSVNSHDEGPIPRPRGMMAMEAKAASADAVPAEPGKSTVNVTVSGSVQLR